MGMLNKYSHSLLSAVCDSSQLEPTGRRVSILSAMWPSATLTQFFFPLSLCLTTGGWIGDRNCVIRSMTINNIIIIINNIINLYILVTITIVIYKYLELTLILNYYFNI